MRSGQIHIYPTLSLFRFVSVIFMLTFIFRDLISDNASEMFGNVWNDDWGTEGAGRERGDEGAGKENLGNVYFFEILLTG